SSLVSPATSSSSAAPPAQRRLVVDAARIRSLQRDFALANHSQPTEGQTKTLVENLIEDEILFREAIALGFEKADRSIGWRLVQKMRYLGEDSGDDVNTIYRRALAMGLH